MPTSNVVSLDHHGHGLHYGLFHGPPTWLSKPLEHGSSPGSCRYCCLISAFIRWWVWDCEMSQSARNLDALQLVSVQLTRMSRVVLPQDGYPTGPRLLVGKTKDSLASEIHFEQGGDVQARSVGGLNHVSWTNKLPQGSPVDQSLEKHDGQVLEALMLDTDRLAGHKPR